jgi:nicotinate-nucleotide--dimethylbenzimidazole phosphoribosyltransferase
MEDKLKKMIQEIKPLDLEMMDRAQERQSQLTKPAESLGRLESLSIQLAGIQGRPNPKVEKRVIFCLAADHGIAQAGVSAFPAEVTPQMVYTFLSGGAGVNVLARQCGCKVVVADMGVNHDFPADTELKDCKVAKGTQNMLEGPAMTREQAIQSVLAGIYLVHSEAELDILGTGDMGIGNTTPSSAITALLTGSPVAEITGRGTGLDDQGLSAKIAAIEKAIAINQPDPSDGLDVLAKVGGFEIGGIAGVIIGGACRGVPVVIDGFISGAGALIAQALAPQVTDYIIAAHQSVEIGHARVLEKLGKKPLVDLDFRLGEGTGAALGIFMAGCAAAVLNEMATFAEAGVTDKEG